MGKITLGRACLLVVAVCASGSGVHAEDIEGSLSVAGNRVTVQALREDRSPANNAVVRIAKAGKVVIEGRINHEGFWLTEVPKAGAYEVWVGDPNKEDDLLRMPISIAADLPESANRPPCCVGPFLPAWTDLSAADAGQKLSREIPLCPAASGLALIAVAGVFYVRFKRERVASM